MPRTLLHVMTETRRHSFSTLDAMRGVAAIAVALYHFKKMYSPNFGFPNGYLAVDLFFILSGFIIAFAYDKRLGQGLTTGQFMTARIIRFAPMIWLGAALGAIQLLTLPHGGDEVLSWNERVWASVLNAAMLPSFVGDSPRMFPVNNSEWSLFYELLANLAFVLTFHRLRGKWLFAAIAVLGALLLATVLRLDHANFGWRQSHLVFGVFRVGFTFLVGVAICRYRHVWQPRIPALNPLIILAAVALSLFVPVPDSAQAAYDCAFIFLIAPTLVMLGARSELTGQRLKSMGVALALLSYPLYAIHYPVYKMSMAVATAGYMPMIAGVAVLAALIPLSLFIARHVDEPIRAWMTARTRHWFDGNKALTTANSMG